MLDRRELAEAGSIAPKVAPLVRVPANGREQSQWIAKQVLDQGVYGIVFPMINTPEDAVFLSPSCYPGSVRARVNGIELPRELDIVEVAADDLELARGAQATVVHDYGDGTLLLEVVQEDGQAAAMPVVPQSGGRVIWRAPQPGPPLAAAAIDRHGASVRR